MDKTNDKSERDLILDLVASYMNLARVFVAVAKSTHDLGRFEESEFARSKAMKFYNEAFRSILQMAKQDRESFSADLQNLCLQIRWLSMQSDEPNSSSKANEDVSMENLLRLLREGG